MKITQDDETLSVSDVEQLGAANAGVFQSAMAAALLGKPKRIDIDLSQTGFVDCGGVGALVALRNSARHRNAQVTVRLLNPAATTRRLLKLTRMDALFPIEAL
jgi:anti-anti-sigma factor